MSKNTPFSRLELRGGGVGFSKWLESFGINSWGDLAALMAAIYSLCLILDWLWKKWSNR